VAAVAVVTTVPVAVLVDYAAQLQQPAVVDH
jgi:hypothetical protein